MLSIADNVHYSQIDLEPQSNPNQNSSRHCCRKSQNDSKMCMEKQKN